MYDIDLANLLVFMQLGNTVGNGLVHTGTNAA